MMKKFIAALLAATALTFGTWSLANARAASVFDATNVPQTFAQLGSTCSSSNVGARATITDGPATPTWGATVTAGGGSSTVAIYCDGTGWKIYAGGSAGITPPPVDTAVLPAPTTNQGNYATGCAGGSCRTFDDHWTATALDTRAWLPGLYINNQYLNGGIGLSYPFSAWTIGNVNGGTGTVFHGYPYGFGTNTAGINFNSIAKAADGSLQLGFGANSYVSRFSADAQYVGGAISSAYTPATMINSTGGMVQYKAKFDIGLNYGSYPGMQCSGTGANGASGTSYNANLEHGYTWTGTALTNVGMSVNNLTASTGNVGGTSSTGVHQVPATNDLRSWHTFAIEYTGDNGGKKWQFYVDGTLVNTVPATQPNGTNFNCSFQIFNSVSANNGWHSIISSTNPPPFYAWISDWQFYKKPGT